MMTYAVIGLFLFFLLMFYIVVQGTRAALAWREAAAKGDVKVIRDIVEDSLKGWSSQKRPKPVAPEIWRGIQTMQLTGVGPDYVRVSCIAESEYKLLNDRWIEVRNPLQEGLGITARAADMLFYELGHFRPDKVQVDVFTTYRDERGSTRRECILTTQASRQQAKEIDWEEWTAEEIVRALGGVYRLSDSGRPLPIQPLEPPPSPEPENSGPAAAGAHS